MRESKLSLENCTKEVLKSLPPNIRVDGGLDIWNNKNLKSLPEGLKVGGYLNLHHCESLTSLPEGLKVGEGLILYDCKLLKSLPEDLQIGGVIYYNSETGFVQIEGWKDDPKIIPPHLKGKLK